MFFIWQVKNILVNFKALLIQLWVLVPLMGLCKSWFTVKIGSHILVDQNWYSVIQIFCRINLHWRDITTESPLPVKGSDWKYIANCLTLICQATCLLLAQLSLLIHKQESESIHSKISLCCDNRAKGPDIRLERTSKSISRVPKGSGSTHGWIILTLTLTSVSTSKYFGLSIWAPTYLTSSLTHVCGITSSKDNSFEFIIVLMRPKLFVFVYFIFWCEMKPEVLNAHTCTSTCE